MKKKLLALAPIIVALWVVFVALSVHGKAHAARPDGQMPIRVGFSPNPAPSGSAVTVTVTLSGNVGSDTHVGMSYNSSLKIRREVYGPHGLTVPAGSDTGTTTIYPTGNSGDQETATASCNGGQASGSVTIE